MAAAFVAAMGLGTAGVAQAIPVQPHPVPTWQTNGRVNAIVVSGNVAYLGGQFTAMRPPGAAAGTGEVTRNHAAAVNLTTGALLPWNPNVNGTVRALRVVGTTVYMGGAFTQVGGVTHTRVAAVQATGAGAVISTFTASASGEVFSVVASGSSLYLGGGFGTVDGVSRPNLAAVNTVSGALLPWAPAVDGQVRAIRLLGFPRMVVGGTFTHLNGASANNIGAVDGDTGNNLPWRDHTTYPIIGLASDANGVYVAGAGGGGNFAAFNPATGAQKWLGGTNGNVQAIGVVGGDVYVGGHMQFYCGPQHGQHTCTNPIARDKLLAVDENTGALTAWNPSANSVLGVFALYGVGSNGDVLVGGDFTSTGQRAQQGYAQYTP
ncbi:MAG TPA: hypothetical protein VHS27_15770 [Gaiellales bacterium]|nr:hypothetical protein [Gaiellales bacterium]